MPVPLQIASAAISFRQNKSLLDKSCKDLTAEEWLRSPCENSNHLLWIAGHIVWARAAVLKFLGAPEWSRPWLKQFARGKKRDDASQYPTPEEVLSAFEDLTHHVTEGLESASEETMRSPAPPNSPPGDGTTGGVINFLAFHETYHVGQLAYLRCWLGHEGPQW
jgi:uncharacterized damage-inducible protein DinB